MTEKTTLPGGAKRWIVLPPAPPDVVHALGLPHLWAGLLFHRGVGAPTHAKEFLGATTLTDPFTLSGMDTAVARIQRAVRGGERIAVYGDFDADGVTATALLFTALRLLGASPVPYLPHRTREGHGLSAAAVQELHRQGVSLIVTVDTGVTAVAEVQAARDLGIDTIVTDHHVALGPTPPAAAVVTSPIGDEASPMRHLAGAGLAFKLAQALYAGAGEPMPDRLLELAAIGTVADLTPLVGENRALVTQGIQALRRSRIPGIRALCEVARLRPDALGAEALSFGIVPRINAAGRLGSPHTSFNLLTTQSPDEALDLANELERLNRERQSLTEELFSSALPEAERQAGDHRLLFVAGEQFVPGVNGLVASRLVDRFQRPSVVASLADGLASASARSIPGFHLANALGRIGRSLVRFGGHAAAAGFVARQASLPDVADGLRADAARQLADADLTPSLTVDAEVSPRDLLGQTFQFLERLSPFGAGNAEPAFLTRGVKVADVHRMGAGGQHASLKLRHGNALWNAVWFASRNPDASGQNGPDFTVGSTLDIVYSISRDSRGPHDSTRLLLLDARPSPYANSA